MSEDREILRRVRAAVILSSTSMFLAALFYGLLEGSIAAYIVAGSLVALSILILGLALAEARQAAQATTVSPVAEAGGRGQVARLEGLVSTSAQRILQSIDDIQRRLDTLEYRVSSTLEAQAARLERGAARLEQAAARSMEASRSLAGAAESAKEAAERVEVSLSTARSVLDRLSSESASLAEAVERIESAVNRFEGEVDVLAGKVADMAAERVAAPLLLAVYEARSKLAAALLAQGVFDEEACRSGGEALLASARAALRAGRIGEALAVVDAYTLLALERAGCRSGLEGEARSLLEEACARLGCRPEGGVEAAVEALLSRQGRV